MKFNLNHDPNNKTLAIPRAALQLSGLVGVSDLIHFSHLRRCTAANLPSGGEKPDGNGSRNDGNGMRCL